MSFFFFPSMNKVCGSIPFIRCKKQAQACLNPQDKKKDLTFSCLAKKQYYILKGIRSI